MSAQHTPGRLTVRENGDANSYAIMDDAGQWLLHMLHNGRQPTTTQSENLRRLAARWNACEGYETETLETANLIESAYAAEGREFELTRQRDALLEALKDVRSDLFMQIENRHGAKSASEYPSIVKAKAAIATAEKA